MTLQRRLGWLLIVVALLGVTVGVRPPEDRVAAVVPWPYGLILYTGDTAEQTASSVALATWAVESVFEYWGISPPIAMDGWQTSLGPASASGMAEELHERSAVRIPGPEGALGWRRRILQYRSRNNLEPLVLVIVPEIDDVIRFRGGHVCGAFFTQTDYPIDAHPSVIPGPAIVMTSKDFLDRPYVLCHEIAHWYFSVARGGVPGESGMVLLSEGAATLAGDQASGSDLYRRIAAIFAEEGDLRDLPRSMIYSVGASVVEILGDVHIWDFWDGCEAGRLPPTWNGLWRKTRSSPQWDCIVDVIESEWQESLTDVQIAAEDRQAYDLELHRFGTVFWLLEPFLSKESRELVERIRSGEIIEDLMGTFWRTVESSHETPRDLDSLRPRETALARDILETTVFEAPLAPSGIAGVGEGQARRLVWRLVGLRWIRNWDAYHRELVRLVRTHVSEGLPVPRLIPWWDPDPAPPGED